MLPGGYAQVKCDPGPRTQLIAYRKRAIVKLAMNSKADVLTTEHAFFSALVHRRVSELDQLLSEDFTLVEVLSGNVLGKSALISGLSSGQLSFQMIDPADALVRLYEAVAIVTGRTRMNGQFGGQPFTAHSRYTHVYIEHKGRWRLAAAQGTPIVGEG
jgi:hypothetical protein